MSQMALEQSSLERIAAASADNSGPRVSASSPTRPTSSCTLDSNFADSAVDMDTPTPTYMTNMASKQEASYFQPMLLPTPLDLDHTLSDKMRRLAGVAWTLEQDDGMGPYKRRRLDSMLQLVEGCLESTSAADMEDLGASDRAEDEKLVQQEREDDNVVENSGQEVEEGEDGEDDDWIDESELIAVRENLAATVKSMRTRHEEQRHLHQLTVQKLEALAHHCITQEQQIQELRLKNHSQEIENDQLRVKAAALQVDASRKEVAVEAMSSAVTGLEGWIKSTTPLKPQSPDPEHTAKRQRIVIRGKGRFRGRYYVDEDGDEAVAYSLTDAAAESQELHDGVKAWLRGFRDVEEEVRQHETPSRIRPQSRFKIRELQVDDDWGDFQSPRSHSPI